MIQFAIYNAATLAGGALAADYSGRVQKATFASNDKGDAEMTGFIPMDMDDAFRLFDRMGLPHVMFNDPGSGALYEGRLEDVSIVDGGVNVKAFGYARALQDIPYTALWSTTDYSRWRTMQPSEFVGRTPDKYNISVSNAGGIRISLKKGQTYANNAEVGSVVFQAPHGSRQIVGFSMDYTNLLPNPGGAAWSFIYDTFNEGYTAGAGTVITGSAGVVFNRTVHYVVTACDYLELGIFNASGAANTPAGDDGSWYVQITNLRVVTSVANRVNTTITNIAGATITLASMANIYNGQQLQVAQGTNHSETCIASAVTSTTVNLTFTHAQAIGDTINAHVIYPDEIVEDIVQITNFNNDTQILGNYALIDSPRLDVFNEVYEDELPADILDKLAAYGDNLTTPRQWEWGVDGQILYFRAQNTANRTWYVDAGDLEIQRTLDDLHNSVYATYQDAYGRTLRATATTDGTSQDRYGVLRQMALPVDTTSATQAARMQAIVLADNKDPKPSAAVTIRKLYDAAGTRWPVYYCRAGDTVVIRNLPPTLSVAIDRVRIFRLSRAEYNVDENSLKVEPENPLPTLDALLARSVVPSFVKAAPIKRVPPWWKGPGPFPF